jgi:hypothetical protein
MAKSEMGRNSMRGKVMRILYTENEDLVRVCYEWQMDNLKDEC